MEIEYKQVKTLVEHCGDCGERLSGNNSLVLPYKCKCGIWKWSFSSSEWEIVE